jgi:hypothetical protein
LSEELGIVGRVTGGRTAYAHNIRRIGADHYRLSWSFDTKIAGSRLRWPRTITRDTDEAGALRFARKWGCSMPNVEFSGVPAGHSSNHPAGGTSAGTQG